VRVYHQQIRVHYRPNIRGQWGGRNAKHLCDHQKKKAPKSKAVSVSSREQKKLDIAVARIISVAGFAGQKLPLCPVFLSLAHNFKWRTSDENEKRSQAATSWMLLDGTKNVLTAGNRLREEHERLGEILLVWSAKLQCKSEQKWSTGVLHTPLETQTQESLPIKPLTTSTSLSTVLDSFTERNFPLHLPL
jgi:hypothetical protein